MKYVVVKLVKVGENDIFDKIQFNVATGWTESGSKGKWVSYKGPLRHVLFDQYLEGSWQTYGIWSKDTHLIAPGLGDVIVFKGLSPDSASKGNKGIGSRRNGMGLNPPSVVDTAFDWEIESVENHD